MKTFVRHEACPQCGSSNNVSVYYNDILRGETYYCHTPDCDYAKTDKQLAVELGVHYDPETQEDDPIVVPGSYILPPLIFGEFARRRLPKSVCEKFGVGIDDRGLPVFPYYRQEYGLVAAKLATGKDDPRFYWAGEERAARLFGMQFIPDPNNLIITEGEFDAIAAHTMTGYTAWSVPNGAKSAKKFIRLCLREIEQFDNVYICFDNDPEGVKASYQAMSMLRASIAKQVILPTFDMGKGKLAKDACDYRMSKREEDFREAIESASYKTIGSIYDPSVLKEAVHEKVFNQDLRVGEPTGIEQLDELLGGWRKKELTIIWGDVSHGKSSISRLLMVKQLMNGKKCFYLPIEDGAENGFTKVIEMMHQVRIISRPDVDFKLDQDELDKWFDDLKSKLIVSNFDGEVSWDELAESIEYAIRIHGCEYILLDHLTIACSSSQRDSMFAKLSDTVKKLRELAKKFNVHIWVVSHITKDPNGEFKGFGSSAIRQITDNLLEINRAKDSDTVYIELKKNRMWGKTGILRLLYDWTKVEFRELEREESKPKKPPKSEKIVIINTDNDEQNKKKNSFRFNGSSSKAGLDIRDGSDGDESWFTTDTIGDESTDIHGGNSERVQPRFHPPKREIRRGKGLASRDRGVVQDGGTSGQSESRREKSTLYIAPKEFKTS